MERDVEMNRKDTPESFLEAFAACQQSVHLNSKAHGFWNGENNQNVPTKLMLIVSELAEAMECHREGMKLDGVAYTEKANGKTVVHDAQIYEKDITSPKFGQPLLKPEGFPIELADAVIRIMDLAEFFGINLAQAILEKHEYNKVRPLMHGGKSY